MSAIYYDFVECYDLIFKDKDYRGEAHYVHQKVVEHTNDLPLSICDIGCGTGRHAEFFLERGYQITGIDVSAEMLRLARKKFAGQPRITFRQNRGSDFRLPYQFTCVISMFSTFGHLLNDEDAFREVRNYFNHLAPGGLFILEFVDRESFMNSLIEHTPSITGTRRPADAHRSETFPWVRLVEKSACWEGDLAYITKRYHLQKSPEEEIDEFVDDFTFRLYGQENLCRILEGVGFETPYIDYGFFNPDEGRLIFTAKKPVESGLMANAKLEDELERTAKSEGRYENRSDPAPPED